MLTVWGRNNSTNVKKVLWCLEELGIGYQRIDAGGQYGKLNDPLYRALNSQPAWCLACKMTILFCGSPTLLCVI